MGGELKMVSLEFLDHENMALDTDIVFLGGILTELWTI